MFIPNEGQDITVSLPGEKLRATVSRVVNDHAIFVEITSQPMTKGHMFRKGDVVGCRRTHTGLEEIWQAMDDRQFLSNQTRKRKRAA